jgi:hypothetical protein
MCVRCYFYCIAVAIEIAFIDNTAFIPLSQHCRVIAASHAHRSRNSKLSLIEHSLTADFTHILVKKR